MTDTQNENCIVCHNTMVENKTWLFECPYCRLLSAKLESGTGAPVQGVESLRKQNFKIILDDISRLFPSGGRILEIGCARGWFLDEAKARQFSVSGIEPDAGLAKSATSKGHDVRTGFFPDTLNGEETFDIIIFNDVFEHLPTPPETLQACHRFLAENGLLVINLPDRGGIFYRIAQVLDGVGLSKPLERLWQKNFSSPHLFYFNANNLAHFVGDHGFHFAHHRHLKSVALEGLWDRLRSGNKTFILWTALLWVGIVLVIPILTLLPKDISVSCFRKGGR